MKIFKIILLLALTTCLTFSCGEDDSESELEVIEEGGPFEISELAGNWKATFAFFVRASDDFSVDIVADGGSVSLTVQSNDRCTFTIDPFDREAYTVSGKMFWVLDDEEFLLAIAWDDFPDPSYFFPEFTGTTFDMGCTSECAEYDFNNDGTAEIADLSFFFIRE